MKNAIVSTSLLRSKFDRLPAYSITALAVLLGLIFGLPHILIPLILGHSQQYTPFAVDRVSALTYDESYIYAAQANYTRLRWKPAYDTDIYEYRDVPTTFPSVPYFAVAALASLVGGTDKAFIVCDFFLPPIAFCLLYFLVRGWTLSDRLATVASLFVILAGFGVRNLFRVIWEVVTTGWTRANQPLEYSRLLHPQLSFTLFLLALLLLWRALESSSLVWLLASGIAGGSLFYVYLYYWPIWIGTVSILMFVGLYDRRRNHVRLWVPLVTAIASSIFYWVSYLQTRGFPNYVWRTARFGIEAGHFPSRPKVVFTFICVGVFLLLLLIFHRFLVRSVPPELRLHARTVGLFTSAVFCAGCAALNMELLTGINVEAMEHYPNRFFYPYLLMLGFVFAGGAAMRHMGGAIRRWHSISFIVAVMSLLAVAALRQTAVSINTAQFHVDAEEGRLLYSWLNNRTIVDDVLLLSVSRLSYLMPTRTHNRLWIPNGTRTTASNEEILHRFLVGAKLFGKGEAWVRWALAQDYNHGSKPLGHTYVYYLFQGNYDSPNRRLREKAIDGAVEEYRNINLRRDLSEFRLDYVYISNNEHLEPVEGFRFSEAYRNSHGALYSVGRFPINRGSESHITEIPEMRPVLYEIIARARNYPNSGRDNDRERFTGTPLESVGR